MKARVWILAALLVCGAASTSMAGNGFPIQRQAVVQTVVQGGPAVQRSSQTYVSVARPAGRVIVARRWVRTATLVAAPRWADVRVRVADGPVIGTAVGVHVGGYHHGHVVVRWSGTP